MSYSIVYDKCFIKVGNKVAPMILSGDNNVYEASNRRRARDWGIPTYYTGNSRMIDKDELIKRIETEIEKTVEDNKIDKYDNDRERTPEEIKNSFGYFTALAVGGRGTSGTTASMYLNFFKNGIKNAKTIEELKEGGISIEIKDSRWNLYGGKKYSVEPPKVKIPTTTEEFESYLKEWIEWENTARAVSEDGEESSVGFFVSFTSDYNVERFLKNMRKSNRKPKEKKRIEVDKYFVLSNSKGYLVKYTRNGYRYSSWSSSAKAFINRKHAESYLNQLKSKRKYNCDTWEIEEVYGRNYFSVAV